MNPKILFRKDLDTEEEFEISKNFLPVVEFRSQIREGDLVIPRYSALPFYKELERECMFNGGTLINTFEQHSYIANAMEWASGALSGLTPRTWDSWADLEKGSYVLKGRTNSRKFKWDTHMFASTVADIPRIARNLLNDSLISPQGLVVREYIPLESLGEKGINGLPLTYEWRVFCYRGEILAHGFYWSGICEYQPGEIDSEGLKFAEKCAKLVEPYANFYVLDVARTKGGEWIVVEVNDGQMSGLSGVCAKDLYSNLKRVL